ncbi:ABC transporter ATP-binding protein [Anaerosalibacter bizertensis]|uniref:ABC transporter ATP-binding protein n=2 Tax=cellular organisms TaxID=131567 RepID=A0A9Q4AD49_9FIRM|nr:ABC transporter ATP-binding protein [Anaerosalibacter bizertensis]MBV1818656.1 ATP-binding cassette domain-containing protein [Bacteroidales bacterium MSK.15.36]MCB5559574.1 ABC transporter ATP-binding protein [Anaerosalibacter bizertensis]MCG4565172.1 ABC transporter ATP-binding protein [Anaerosalibacter bizertensis]MCG4582784.1 ABC transporter ATP-binding protein [Anaerosalibacter bizertensis]MCG4584476.1 ABC transporter ATP-binding protein [Anaerosalibacter bizertensis]
MFTLENVKYKDVLQIQNLKIHSGKVTVIVGESGSGKSTLLRLLNRMVNPTEGEIFYNGKNIREINPVNLRRKVVMLPQNPIMFPGTIKDNLLIGFKFSEKPLVDDNKLNEAMKIVKLDKKLDDKVDKLSGGEKQRVALCRTMLLEPEVFLLDEPSSALDEGTEDIIIKNIIDYVVENKKTLVMVTHSIKIAEEYGENILEIGNGKVIRNEMR